MQDNTDSGFFSRVSTGTGGLMSDNSGLFMTHVFTQADASRCSPIYKSTSKITIRSAYALMIIKN